MHQHNILRSMRHAQLLCCVAAVVFAPEGGTALGWYNVKVAIHHDCSDECLHHLKRHLWATLVLYNA
jgi:hypothetical protein